jgi:hypothetical protein
MPKPDTRASRCGWPVAHIVAFVFALGLLCTPSCRAQTLPSTAGETLSGDPIVLAQAVKGHPAILIAGFSRAGGNGTGDWVKAIQTDPTFAHTPVYRIAMLAAAPGFIRGVIRNGMKKGLSPSQQKDSVVLASDEPAWRNFFSVTTDGDPYVALLDAQGKMLWHGHGAAASLEPQLKAALR